MAPASAGPGAGPVLSGLPTRVAVAALPTRVAVAALPTRDVVDPAPMSTDRAAGATGGR